MPDFFPFFCYMWNIVIFNLTLLIIYKSKQNKCTIDIKFNFQNTLQLQKVSIHVHPAFTPPYLFPIGDVAVTYTATDLTGNQASCTFHVRVIGESPLCLGWFVEIILFLKDFASLASTIPFLLTIPTGIDTYSRHPLETYILFNCHYFPLIFSHMSLSKSSQWLSSLLV